MKKFKKALLIILCICVMLPVLNINTIPVEAEDSNRTYIALGDSITSGYGLETFIEKDNKNKNSSYNFVTRLGKKLGYKTVNLGVEGIDSTMLLRAISKPSGKAEKAAVTQIKTASLITLSVGGNNVFIPLLNSVNDRISGGKNIFNADEKEIKSAIISLLFNPTEISKLQKNIAIGAETFTGNSFEGKEGDFSKIISTIKSLNPKAKIVVQTLYNPYKLIMPDSVEAAIKSMNSEIIRSSGNGKNYQVADVYSAFAKADSEFQLVNADTGKTFDPHPTRKGHEVIYTLVAYAANSGKLPYSVISNVIKGKVSTRISSGELILSVTPAVGYKLPQTIFLTIGKDVKKTLTIKNGVAAVPIAEVNTDITVTAECLK